MRKKLTIVLACALALLELLLFSSCDNSTTTGSSSPDTSSVSDTKDSTDTTNTEGTLPADTGDSEDNDPADIASKPSQDEPTDDSKPQDSADSTPSTTVNSSSGSSSPDSKPGTSVDSTPDTTVNSTVDSTPDSTVDSKPEPIVETVTVEFNPGNGDFADDDFDCEIRVEKGTRIASEDWPEAARNGYEFLGWFFDEEASEECLETKKFYNDTVLYAGWKKIEEVTPTPDPEPETPLTDPVIIFYNTASGYFEDADDYEIQIERGTRITDLPTPLHSDPSMLFIGWYFDTGYTTPVSVSNKYTEDETVLYAKWQQIPLCLDGSYNHSWGLYYEYTLLPVQKTDKALKTVLSAKHCSLSTAMALSVTLGELGKKAL